MLLSGQKIGPMGSYGFKHNLPFVDKGDPREISG